MTKKFLLAALFLALCIFLNSAPVFAAKTVDQLVPCGGPGQHSCTICDFFEMTKRATNFLIFGVIPALSALLLVLGGLYYLFSKGNPEALTRAKTIFGLTLAGFLIVFIGWVFVNTFFMTVGVAEWDGFHLDRSWWKISATCSVSWETKESCGDGIVQQQNEEECEPDETMSDCQGRTGYDTQQCENVIAHCDMQCKLHLSKEEVVESDDDDDDVEEEKKEETDDDTEKTKEEKTMCTDSNRDKVGLGCWPGEETVLKDIKKKLIKEIDEEYDKQYEDMIKMMEAGGRKMTEEEKKQYKDALDLTKHSILEQRLQEEAAKIEDPEKRKLLCERGKYKCNEKNELVCEPTGEEVYDQCCLNKGVDLPNMKFDIYRSPGAHCGNTGKALSCGGPNCDEVCKKHGQVCIGVGLTDVPRNHCVKIVHDLNYDCNFSGNLTTVNCHVEFATWQSACCEKSGTCGPNRTPCCTSGSGVEFAVGESACYCK